MKKKYYNTKIRIIIIKIFKLSLFFHKNRKINLFYITNEIINKNIKPVIKILNLIFFKNLIKENNL